jgi:formylglycine-generating enzyme required for sulfatase activity
VISRADPEPDPKAERIAALVRQLGDDRFARREEAVRELEKIGEPAIDALRKARYDRDPEVRRRVAEVLKIVMPTSRKTKTIGLEMMAIEQGEFTMGSPRGEAGRRADEAEHRVRITRPFYLGAYEVTQEEYEKVMKTNPSWFVAAGGGKDKIAGQNTSRFPVERVTWYDAIEFCNRLSKLDGYEPYYTVTDVKREKETIKGATVKIAGGNGYRLPTEAEWEYACRAGTTTAFHFGGETRSGLLNCKPLVVAAGYGSSPKWPELARTARVGSSPPNDWQLYDMHGNVAEWCWDWYDKDYYNNSPRDDPNGPNKGDQKVLRGGSWLVTEASCRSASRFLHTPDESNYVGGFRIARTP